MYTFAVKPTKLNMNELMFSLLTGLISGVISSGIFFVVLSRMRPKLQISNHICKANDLEGKVYYGFKVLNLSKFNALELKCEVLLNTPFNSHGGSNHSIRHINLIKDNVLHFSRFNKSDGNGSYAIVLTTREDIESLWVSDSQSIEIKIHCKHSFSGISKSFGRKYYTKRDSIKTGLFNFGKTFDIS